MSFFKYFSPISIASSAAAARTMIRFSFPQSLEILDCSVSRLPPSGADLDIRLSLPREDDEPVLTSLSIVEGERPRFVQNADVLGPELSEYEISRFGRSLKAGGFLGVALTSPLWFSAIVVKVGQEIRHESYGQARSLLQGLARYLDDDELSLFESASKNMWREQWARTLPLTTRRFQEWLSDCSLVTLKAREAGEQDWFVWIDHEGNGAAAGEYAADGSIEIGSGPNEMNLKPTQIKHLARAHYTIDLPSDEADLRLARMKANPSRYF